MPDLVDAALDDPRLKQPTHYATGATPDGDGIDAVLQPVTSHILGRCVWLVSAIVRRAGYKDAVQGRAHRHYDDAKREFDAIIARWNLKER